MVVDGGLVSVDYRVIQMAAIKSNINWIIAIRWTNLAKQNARNEM